MLKRLFLYLLLALIAYGVWDYFFLSKLTAPLNFNFTDATKKQSGASVPKEQAVPREIVALRQRHHLRPLTDAESGTPTKNLPRGIYGFSTCEVQTINATRTNSCSLEIHKHQDGIAYYVGYASEDHIEKYVTRQKNFHILATLEPTEKAPLLFEIPVDFVSKCTSRSVGDVSGFDLFVMTIPELHT
jgi:hypothetical protein